MSRRKRHTPEQIVAKLGEADALLNAGQSLAQVIQHLESQAKVRSITRRGARDGLRLFTFVVCPPIRWM